MRAAPCRKGAIWRVVSLEIFLRRLASGTLFARANTQRSRHSLSAGGSAITSQAATQRPVHGRCKCPLQNSVLCSRGKRHPVFSRNRLSSLPSQRRPLRSVAVCSAPPLLARSAPHWEFRADGWEGAMGYGQCRLSETHPRAVLLWS